jgi:hypothetical protein
VRDSAATSIESQVAELSTRVDALTVERETLAAERATLTTERDEYRKLYLQTLALCRKLELGITGAQRERLSPGDTQLTMSLLGMLLGDGARGTPTTTEPPPAAAETQVEAHTRAKPTGRKPLPEKLPRVEIELLPPEVQQKGTDAFVRIGEDVTETVERRPGSMVVVRVRKPKFVSCELRPKVRFAIGRHTTAHTSWYQ